MDAVNMSWILSAKAIPRSLPLVFSSRAKQNQRYTGVRLDSHESTRATNSSKDVHTSVETRERERKSSP